MNYLVVYEDNGDMALHTSLGHVLANFCDTRPCTIYELRLTRRKRPRPVSTDRKVLIEFASLETLTNVRNPSKGKPGLPEGSQHITTDEDGELVIRPYQEA